MEKIKKVISILLCAVIAATVFAGCSKKENKKEETKETTTAATTTELATDEAKISGSEAINLLKSYKAAELGLEDIKEEYQFMLGTTGSEINGKKYIRAVAGAMVENGEDDEGNTTYQMQSYGTFFISFDGKEILVAKDDDKYDTIKITKEKLDAVTTTAQSTQQSEKTTAAEKE